MSETIGTVRQAILAVDAALAHAGFVRDAEVEGSEAGGMRYRLRVSDMGQHVAMADDWAVELHVFLVVPILPGMEVETSIAAPEATERIAGIVASLNGKCGVGVNYQGSTLGRTGPDYVSDSVFTVAYMYQAI